MFRNNKKVVILENTDFKIFSGLQWYILTIDVSFISIKLLAKNIRDYERRKEVIILIKPQFEVGKERLQNIKVLDKENI